MFTLLFTRIAAYAQIGLHFDGKDDYINCGTDTSLANFNKNLSIEAWVYADNWTTNVYEGCIAVKEDNNSNYGYMLRAGNGGRLNFAIGRGTWRELTTSSSVMKTGQWYHVAATYNGNIMKLYLDGVVIDSMKETDPIGASNNIPLTLGSHSLPTSYNRFWSGKIDEVRIWRTTRTAKEISDNMKNEYCDGQKGLVGYFKLNDGSPNTGNTANSVARDYSGYGNDGRLLNFDLIKTTSNWVSGVSLSSTVSYDTITVRRCESYRMPDTKKMIYQTGTYTAKLDNYMGCDSMLTIDLTIDRASRTDLKYVVCDSLASPSVDAKYYTKTGKYTEILRAANGCDSFLTIDLLVTKPTRDTLNYNGCYSVKLKGFGKTVKSSGIYVDSFLSYHGCDSILVHKVNILTSSRDTQTLQLCRFVVCPTDNDVIYKKVGRYYDTIQNAVGCDSFIVYNVVPATSKGEITVKACQKYTSPSGLYTWNQSGTYADTLLGANRFSCDSFITIYLEIVRPSVEQISIAACEEYTSPQGQRVTESQKIFESIQSYLGCDSINYIYNVNIIKINPKISRDWNTLISAENGEPGVTFQWLDCKTDFAEIPNAMEGTYSSPGNAELAVEITKGKCIDTSRCQIFTYTKISGFITNRFKVFPNPSKGSWNIEVPSNTKSLRIEILGLNGQSVWNNQVHPQNKRVTIDKYLPAGVYWVKVSDEVSTEVIPLEIAP